MEYFSCSNCKKKQPFKRIYLMSKISTWRCYNCDVLLKPQNLTGASNTLGFISYVVPGYLGLYYFKIGFLNSMLVGLVCGIVFYILSLFYYYKRTILKEVDDF